MPSRTLPGLGLSAFWLLGEDGWKTGMDDNIRLLSALCQCAVKSRSTALPGSPANGDMYIVRADAGADANKIAIRDNGAWVYATPKAGFIAFVADATEFVAFVGGIWAPLAAGGSSVMTVSTKTANYGLVIGDGGSYIRMNSGATNTLTVPTNASIAFPVGTVVNVRQVAAGQTTIAGAVGVTINTAETLKLRRAGSSASLIKVATDEWDLTGDLEAL